LEKLKELKIENVENNLNIENSLRTIDGVKDFEDKEKIMQNVQHPIINNCIEIKSVLV
jgi:predicted transposase YbfD/YdcC